MNRCTVRRVAAPCLAILLLGGGLFAAQSGDSATARGAPSASVTAQEVSSPPLSAADSLKKAVIRDSLFAEKARHIGEYQKFSASPDSIFNVRRMTRQAIFSSDAISLSDLVRSFPSIESVPLSLSNGLNRYMPYGFALPAPRLEMGGELFADILDGFHGADFTGAAQLAEISCGPGGRLTAFAADDDLVVPETQFLWENGLFYENILNVRVARPLSQNLTMSIICNNRFLKSQYYTTKGDVSGLYNNFITDTNLLVQGGKNPLVQEQNTQFRFNWKGKNGSKGFFHFGYADDQNEISHGFVDTTGNGKDSLQWDRIFRFGANATAGESGLPLWRASRLDINARLIREGHTRHALANDLELFGRNNEYAVAFKPYLALHADTIAIQGIATRHEQTLYDNSNRVGNEAAASAAVTHCANFRNIDAEFSARLGEQGLALRNVKTDNTWTGSVCLALTSGGSMMRLFARREVAAYPQLYDTGKTPFADFFTPYQTIGAETALTYKKAGLAAGICGLTGVDGLDSISTWPENILPYRQPRAAWFVEPFFGRWRGFTVSSRWMFQDCRPYLKALNSVGFQAHPLGGREHITADLTFDYWSRRDSLYYGGAGDWNREVLDVKLYTAVQIKTFSLFYKIDNILNRNYAYVPGYRMPGMTFRWGFQWLLQG